MSRPAGVCFFCKSRGPLTDEHAIMRWAKDLLGVKGKVNITRGGVLIRTAKSLKVVAHQALCAQCNNAWLSQYEERFKRVMGKALVGQGPISINRYQQDIASFWAIKSGLLLELAARFERPPVHIPDSVFRWLHEHESAPPGSAVWIGVTGPRRGEPPQAGHISNQPIGAADGKQQIGNVITFFIGNLVLKTLIVELPERGAPPAINAVHSPCFLQISPVVSDPVTWPPLGLTYSDLQTPEILFWPVRVPAVLQPFPADFKPPADFV